MASAEDQAAAAALLGGDPAAFDALLSTLMSASNADRAAAEAAFHRLRNSHPEPLALRLGSATPTRSPMANQLVRLPSPSASTSTKDTDKQARGANAHLFDPRVVDTNTDAHVLDTNDDVVHAHVLDPNADHVADARVLETNADHVADAHVLETNADHVARVHVADTNADHVADARVVDTTDDVTNAITMTDLESIYSVAELVTTALEVSGGHDQGGNNDDVSITVDQSTYPEPEDVPLLTRKLVPALLTVGIVTMGADISTVLHRPAGGVIFGHNKLAYFLILAGIFAAGAAEVMTAIWLARSSAPDGRRRRFSFARAAICASIVPFVAVVGIYSTVV